MCVEMYERCIYIIVTDGGDEMGIKGARRKEILVHSAQQHGEEKVVFQTYSVIGQRQIPVVRELNFPLQLSLFDGYGLGDG
jgi:hypothetical protein